MAITPGPWKHGVRKDGSIWLSIGDFMTGPHYQGDLVASPEDAQAITAIPELLAAVQAVLPILELAFKYEGNVFGVSFNDAVDAESMLRAALDKVAGKAS